MLEEDEAVVVVDEMVGDEMVDVIFVYEWMKYRYLIKKIGLSLELSWNMSKERLGKFIQ